MDIRMCVADPAGNITIFVLDKFERKDYAEIAKKLLVIEEFHAEQVGFLEKCPDGHMHMQMMGGEFCGNATRSFGYYLSRMLEDHPKELMVDVSGSNSLLKTEVDLEAGTSRTQMPLPLEITELDLKEEGVYAMVIFEGICHIMVEGTPRDSAFIEKAVEAAEKVYSCDGYGIMFLEDRYMTPVVYVKETNSMVWESSCGSGSMAAAVYLSRDKANGKYVYEFTQPGGTIEATVYKENGKCVECKMGGKVAFSEEITVHIE